MCPLSSWSHYKTGASSEQNDVGKFQSAVAFKNQQKVVCMQGLQYKIIAEAILQIDSRITLVGAKLE